MKKTLKKMHYIPPIITILILEMEEGLAPCSKASFALPMPK